MSDAQGQQSITNAFCPSCGQSLPSFASYCANCGSAIPAQVWQGRPEGAAGPSGSTPGWQWGTVPSTPQSPYMGSSYAGASPPEATRPAQPYSGPYPEQPGQGGQVMGGFPSYTPTTPASYPPTVGSPSAPLMAPQWYAGPAGVEASAPPTRGRRFSNKVIASISALVLVALLGTGAFAFYHFVLGAHTETVAAQYVPSNTVFFGAVDLLNAQSHGHQFNLGTLTNPGPNGQLSPIQQATGLNWNTDVKPWLGRVVAVAVFPGGGGSSVASQYGIVIMIQSSDDGKAQAALTKVVNTQQGHGSHFSTSTYGGLTVYAEDNGSGVTGGSAAAGKGWVALSNTSAALQAVIDRLNGNGDRLSDSSAFHTATQNMPTDRFGTFYVNIRELTSSITAGSGGTDIPFVDTYPVAGGSMGWTTAGARFQVTLPASKDTGVGNLAGDTTGLASLAPANSVAYLGAGNLGALLQQVNKISSGSTGSADIAQQALGVSADTPALQQPAAVAVIPDSSGNGSGYQAALLLRAPDASATAQLLNQIVQNRGWTTQTTTVAGQQAVDVYSSDPSSLIGPTNYSSNDSGQYLVAAVAQVNGTFVIASTEDTLASVIQASQGGSSLAQSSDFKALAQGAPTGGAAVEYVNIAAAADSLHLPARGLGMQATGLLVTEVWNSQEIQLTVDAGIHS